MSKWEHKSGDGMIARSTPEKGRTGEFADALEDFFGFDRREESLSLAVEIVRRYELEYESPEEGRDEALRVAAKVADEYGRQSGDQLNDAILVEALARAGLIRAPTVGEAPHESVWRFPTDPPDDDCPHRRATFVWSDDDGQWHMEGWIERPGTGRGGALRRARAPVRGPPGPGRGVSVRRRAR